MARARGAGRPPAFVFPEMINDQYARPGWYLGRQGVADDYAT